MVVASVRFLRRLYPFPFPWVASTRILKGLAYIPSRNVIGEEPSVLKSSTDYPAYPRLLIRNLKFATGWRHTQYIGYITILKGYGLRVVLAVVAALFSVGRDAI